MRRGLQLLTGAPRTGFPPYRGAERHGHGPPRPAHPRHRTFWMLTELLRDLLGTAPITQSPDTFSDGLPDLPGAGFLGSLQRRHEQSIGSRRGDGWAVVGGYA